MKHSLHVQYLGIRALIRTLLLVAGQRQHAGAAKHARAMALAANFAGGGMQGSINHSGPMAQDSGGLQDMPAGAYSAFAHAANTGIRPALRSAGILAGNDSEGSGGLLC